MKRRDHIVRIDPELVSVLDELHKQMNEAQGYASKRQAQRELAFRIKETGIHQFRRLKKKDDELFPFRI